MPFSFYSPPSLTNEQVSPYANLIQNALQTYAQAVQAKYLPLTTQSEAASKLAYANLMGPQFIAKLMGNPQILANIPESQRDPLLRSLLNTGTTQTFNPKVAETFSGKSMPEFQAPAAISQAFRGRTPEEQQRLDQMTPGESYIVPQIPPSKQKSEANKTWAERRGEYAGVEEEGKELGKYRAQAINDLDTQYQQALEESIPLNDIASTLKSPLFQNMRRFPFFQDKQLNALAKIGTPEEQKSIGEFLTSTQKAVASTITGFRGRILDKEVTLANNMKVSPNDTYNVALGKIQSLLTFNKMTQQRARIASNLMIQKHLNKGEALEQADREINGDTIRKQVKSFTKPESSEDDINYTAKKYGMSREEVIRQLKAKGKM